MFLSDTWLFIIALIITGSLLFLLVYFVITLSDVECDYINVYQCCSTLNIFSIPKVAVHAFLTVLLLLTGHYWLFLLNIPLVSYLIREIYKVPCGNIGIYDPAEIHNRGMIKKHLRDCTIYLGFYLCMFFIYLYCSINSLLKGDPIRRHEDEEIITDF